ncbi:sulfur oxidation c-type cytochrome SoxX [Rhodovulum euryhalinum]|uniref:Sulfur-oxidizing protein SoxX n=1 Tax=Rhodovulum euryhalinum TaxID=35805 RepID=A0A4R2L1W5_9RHOB|nr:sulfur oxidation c-type cytochrome SoxX [Rhodovulum euryhalinum]TCO73025.1 sulfur-oxidizing protein SoxX [Rhodovulum euryhalinum]
MKKVAITALCLAAGLTVAHAAEVAPADVKFDDYGFVPAPLTDTPGDPEAGRKLMSSRSNANCIACHTATDLADIPFHGEVGPSFDGVAMRYPEAMIRGILINPKNVFEGTVMPAFYKVEGFNRPGEAFTSKPIEGEIKPLLTAQQIEDAVAYLMTLKN